MTLYIGLYRTNDGSAATTGTLARSNGTIETDVLGDVAADVWSALAGALTEAAVLAVKHLVIATNSEYIFWRLSQPEHFKPEDNMQWNVLRLLFSYQCKGGTWQIVGVTEDKLGKAKERWQQRP